jgi:hypothetical protein
MTGCLLAGAGPVLGDRYESPLNKVSENVASEGMKMTESARGEDRGQGMGEMTCGYRN